MPINFFKRRMILFNYSRKSLNTIILSFTLITVVFITMYHYQILQYNNLLRLSITRAQFSKNYNDSEIQEKDVKNGYVVWSSTCLIPNIKPFHESIKKFIYQWKPKTCSTRQPLTYTWYNSEIREHYIIINRTVLTNYQIDESDVKCCYSSISRKYIEKITYNNMDDRHDFSDFVCFKNQTKLPGETEFLYVECNTVSNSIEVFRTIHGIVPIKTSVKTRLNGDENYSVLLLGIDAISRLNLIRAMPKTWHYLQENQWISLKGYNKVGDNTLPNFGAILTGFSYDDMRKICYKHDEEVFDECPFIWKEFKQKSYVTAYIEDSPYIGTFNFHKPGFRNSPTDYYVRPLMMAGMEKLKIQWDGNREYCMGESTQAEYLLQYVTEFAQRFQNHSYFNLLWLNSFSHEKLNQPQAMDERFRKFLEDLQPYLNSTIVIFLSDHGMRYGDIRQTYVGWFEERMPSINFLLPTSFKKKFPDKYKNLIYNKNRLTSPFDLYATLQDILYGSVRRKPHSCPTCDSLFQKTRFNRTCEQAGIPLYWCTCSSSAGNASTTDPVVLSNVRFVIDEMNKYLVANKHKIKMRSSCAILSLRKIISVRTQSNPSMSAFSGSESYIIVFETDPNKAVFEATIRTQGDFNVEDSISRINAYGDQSSCVLYASKLNSYCFCVENSNKELEKES